jgi:hypothetical protein
MKNEYEIRGDTIAIKLKNKKGVEKETLIDLDDLEKVESLGLCWHLKFAENNQQYYCRATQYMGMVDGKPKYKMIYLHRVIAGDEKGKYIDHINHDSLDNRKSNLASVDNKTNVTNRKTHNRNSKTGVRNVSYSHNKYIVQIQIDGKNTRMGSFDNLEDAAKLAEECRKKYYNNEHIHN